MATLEKIRSKSVLLLIIIAAALLAFILGDFLTSGRSLFGAGTTIAKVGSHKIDVQELQTRVEQASQQASQQGRQVDGAVIQQQVLNQMITEALFQEEMEKLGIVVTDDELTAAMLGDNSAPFNQYVQQQVGVESAATLHDMATNPAKYGLDSQQAAQLNAMWLDYEKQMETSLMQQKFQALFTGTIVANELDARALYDENAATAHIAYAKKDLSTLSNDDYAVSDDEVRKEWNANKKRYELAEPTRRVEYISVEIAPSAADIQLGSIKVEDALLGLNTKPGTEGLEGMSEFIAERKPYTPAELRRNTRLKSFVDTTAVGRAGIVSHTGNAYTLAKVLSRSTGVDSVNIDFLMVQGTPTELDSMVTALNSGALTLAQALESELVVQSQDSAWVSLVDPQMITLKEPLLAATTGRYFTPDTLDQGGRIFRVRSRKAPVEVVEVAQINYTVEPTNATINTLNGDLSRYVSENNTAQAFVDNATEAGYTVLSANVTPSSATLGNLNESHSAVAWALDAKKGAVSPVMGDETTGRYLAVAVVDVYDDYTPARDPQVAQSLTNTIRNNKKAAALLEQYNGKANDVAGYAALMGTPVDSTTVAFGQMFIPRLGMNESALAAHAATAQPGELVGPMQSANSVIVFTVTGVDTQGRPYSYEENARTFDQQRGATALGRNLPALLIGNRKVDNRTTTFYK